MGERETETHVYFWRSESPFSQWHQVGFQDNEGNYYHTAEHYMMVEKARLMGHWKIVKAMLKCKSPRKVKSLGRKVTPWNENLWLQERENIVTRGNMFKFSQHPTLQRILLDSNDKILVEASPYDNIWGIGLAPEDDAVLDEECWDGLNLLGKCLMRVRETLRRDRVDTNREGNADEAKDQS